MDSNGWLSYIHLYGLIIPLEMLFLSGTPKPHSLQLLTGTGYNLGKTNVIALQRLSQCATNGAIFLTIVINFLTVTPPLQPRINAPPEFSYIQQGLRSKCRALIKSLSPVDDG